METMSSSKFSSKLPTSTPKESSRPRVSGEIAEARGGYESTLFTPLGREMDSMRLENIEKEFEELTAQYNRCRQELDKNRASGSMSDETRLKTLCKSTQPSKHVSYSVSNQSLPPSTSNVGAHTCTSTGTQNTPTTVSRSSHSREAEINRLLEALAQLESSNRSTGIQFDRGEHLSDRLQSGHTTPSHSSTQVDMVPLSTSSSIPNRVRKQKEPDKFDGKSVEWKDFLVHFEQVSDWNCWSYEERSQQLVMSLRGEAQKLLGDLTLEQQKDYDNLKSILTKRFNPQELVIAHRCEFRSRKRNKGESPSDYGYALRRLGCLAFPEMTYNDREINVLEQFINGIGNSAIHDHVIFHHPKTLEEAISLAIEFEAVKGPQFSLHKPLYGGEGVNSVNSKKENEPFKEMTELMKLMKDCVDKLTKFRGLGRKGKNKDVKNMECYECHQLGHLSYDCPKKSAEAPQKPQNKEN